jgi:ADP-ribose pyrophosphatase YjhB (NUDIX family)
VIVGCIATWEDRILLCKRAIEPRKDLWNLPAGFLEEGESLSEGAARETYEEAGAQVEIIRPFALFNLPRFSQVYVHFLARLKSPEIRVTPESSEVALLSENEIPFDEMAFHSSTFTIEKYLEHGSTHLGIHVGTLTDKHL